ncbi:MAG: prolyl oligopeptidase family serine peptidase [Pseudomonadales bacterium]|nr:prolyl oligopeptidase family serine peptidase [Pseudomonadales bacterium]
MTADAPDQRFRDRDIRFSNGVSGRNIEIPSASPRNYHQVICEPSSMPGLSVDGKLFIASGSSRKVPGPLVIIAPGSLGVADSHLAHAESLLNAGISAFVLDSFGERSVTSTVADQTQFSFAASAYDVLAAWQHLAAMPEIDARRIGAQGHSRGGSAVLTAANRRFADAVTGAGRGLCAVLAAYPWCGHQFLDAGVGGTRVHVLMGDADQWCSAMQAQAHVHAIRIAGGAATMRLVGGAQHSFDRGTAVADVAEARVSPGAPIAFLANDGAFIHPLGSDPDPDLVDRDLMVYALKAGYGKTGAKIGSNSPGEADLFREDMLAFWRGTLDKAGAL